MDQKQLEEIKDAVKEGIDKNVNGKINSLTTKIDAHIASDNAWKEEYGPYLRGIANVSIAGKLLVGFAIGGAAILEFITRFTKLFK